MNFGNKQESIIMTFLWQNKMYLWLASTWTKNNLCQALRLAGLKWPPLTVIPPQIRCSPGRDWRAAVALIGTHFQPVNMKLPLKLQRRKERWPWDVQTRAGTNGPSWWEDFSYLRRILENILFRLTKPIWCVPGKLTHGFHTYSSFLGR